MSPRANFARYLHGDVNKSFLCHWCVTYQSSNRYVIGMNRKGHPPANIVLGLSPEEGEVIYEMVSNRINSKFNFNLIFTV